MRRLASIRLLAAALVWLLPALVHAQETTGSLSGTVVKAGGEVLPGATVHLTSSRGEREVVTDAQGRFLFGFLTPGTYDVRITAEGMGDLIDEDVTVGLGARVLRRYELRPVMEESMEIAAPEEAPAPIVDLTVQSTGSNIPTEIAEQLPLARNISSVVFLTPGVKDGGGTGSSNPSISGSSGLENQYVFDGINVTNAGYGALGAYSIFHGSSGAGINFNFVKETQVISGGFEPEYGQATGGIVNIVTKSGSNEWEGTVYGFLQPSGLEGSRNTPDLVTLDIGEYQGVGRMDYGADIGGPIRKDHVFFWVGLNPQRIETKRRAPLRDYDGDGQPDYDLWKEGTLTREDKTLSWAGKLTFQINPEHRIDLSAFGDPSETNDTYSRGSNTLVADDYSLFSGIDYGYKNYSLKYQGQATPNFLIDFQIAKAENTFSEFFAPEFDQNRYTNNVPIQLGTGPLGISGGIGYFEDNESLNDQISLKFTNIVGDHEIRWGYGQEDVQYNARTDRTGPGAITRNGVPTTTGVSVQRRLDTSIPTNTPGVQEIEGGNTVIYRIVRGLLSDPNKETQSDYQFAFIQDDWSITPNVHLNFGVRWERQSLSGELVEYTFPAEFSPRVGISWDPSKKGSSKIYGHWGRFYEKVPLDMAVRIFSPETGISRGDYFDRNLTMPIPDGTGGSVRYSQSLSAVDDVVPGTRNSFTDEWVLGYQRTLGTQERWKLKAEGQFRELGRILEDFDVSVDAAVCDELANGTRVINGWSDVTEILLPGSDQIFGNAVDCGYLVGNMQAADTPGVGSIIEPERKYKALIFEVSRLADEKWFLTLQYTLSRLEGNYEGLFRNDNGQSDPNLTSLYDFVYEPAFADTYKSGVLNTDRTHRIQAFGFYNWDNGWFINSRAVIQSGQPKLQLASHPLYQNQGEIQLAPRGSLGRTPTEWNVDLGFGKKFTLSTNYDSTITLSMDIFNLFNHVQGDTFDFNSDAGPGDFTDYDTFVESVANGIPNDDYLKALTYTNPRQIRIGATWRF